MTKSYLIEGLAITQKWVPWGEQFVLHDDLRVAEAIAKANALAEGGSFRVKEFATDKIVSEFSPTFEVLYPEERGP